MGPYKEKQKKNPSKDMKCVRSIQGETRRGRIGNKISGEEVEVKNLLIELKEK
jgi:hypothetical protein